MKKLLFLLFTLSFAAQANEFKISNIIKGKTLSIKSKKSEIIVSLNQELDINKMLSNKSININLIALSMVFKTALNFENFYNTQKKLSEIYNIINNEWDFEKWQTTLIDACMFLENKNCLNSFVENSLDQELRIRSLMYLYGMSNDWQEQYSILNKALEANPKNEKILFESQKLSLTISLAYTEKLIQEMQKNYIWLDLGMDSMIDGEFTVGKGLSEFFFNTYYAISLALVPGYEESVVEEFKRQYKEVLTVNSKLKIALENHIKSNGQYWITKEQSEIINNKLNWGTLDQHPIFKIIQENGIVPKAFSQDEISGIPSYKTLGFKNRDGYWARNFVQKGWRTSLAGEINILNAVLFVYGPGVIKAAGSTRIGVKLVTKLRLDRLITIAKSLPKPFDGLSIIVLMEFADGHAFKFIYSGYLALRDVNSEPIPPELELN